MYFFFFAKKPEKAKGRRNDWLKGRETAVTKGDSGGDRTEKSGDRRKISNDRSETAVTEGRITVIGQRHNVRREDSNETGRQGRQR